MRRILQVLLIAAALAFTFNAAQVLDEVEAGTPSFGTPEKLEQALAVRFASRIPTFTVVYSGDTDELSRKLKQTIRKALDADEYTAYIVDSYLYSIRTWGSDATIKFTVTYRESAEQTAVVDREVGKVLNEIIRPAMNGHEKVKAVHDWIVRRTAYDRSLQRYTAYDALLNRSAVCQGYALLGYKMLTAAGIPARIVEGKVSTGDHAWNLVKLDGKWYHLDLTWDDPVPDGGHLVSYAYYLKTDKEMRRDHRWTKTYPAAQTDYAGTLEKLKAADTTRFLFYETMENDLGLAWLKPENTASSPDDLEKRVRAALGAGKSVIKVRYADGSGVKAAVKKALQRIDGIRSYRYGTVSFGSDGSVLLELAFTMGN